MSSLKYQILCMLTTVNHHITKMKLAILVDISNQVHVESNLNRKTALINQVKNIYGPGQSPASDSDEKNINHYMRPINCRRQRRKYDHL